MKSHWSSKDIEAVEALIDRWVVAEDFNDKPTLDLKIALLALGPSRIKHERQAVGGGVDFETYIQCRVFADIDRLVVVAPKLPEHLGAGTAAIQLQAPLLLFLLLHHRNRFRVLEIIQHFIAKVRPQLAYLDFKQTKTGVIRCFTNTRFAAHVLRDYGLLKFTQREAYKTCGNIAGRLPRGGRHFPHTLPRRSSLEHPLQFQGVQFRRIAGNSESVR